MCNGNGPLRAGDVPVTAREDGERRRVSWHPECQNMRWLGMIGVEIVSIDKKTFALPNLHKDFTSIKHKL
jgi:hypothetical protein